MFASENKSSVIHPPAVKRNWIRLRTNADPFLHGFSFRWRWEKNVRVKEGEEISKLHTERVFYHFPRLGVRRFTPGTEWRWIIWKTKQRGPWAESFSTGTGSFSSFRLSSNSNYCEGLHIDYHNSLNKYSLPNYIVKCKLTCTNNIHHWRSSI